VEAEEIEVREPTEADQDLAREYRALLENILELRGAPQIREFVRSVEGPEALADIVGYSPDISLDSKVELLETLDLTERLEKVIAWGRDTLAELQLKEKVSAEVSGNLEKQQREAILRQQMAAIRKELGEDDGSAVDGYREAVAERTLPEHVETELLAEIDKLERTPEQAAEHGWIRTWIDTVLEIPWDKSTEEVLDLTEARAQLDADHTGLEKVKERLIEHLAVRKLRADRARADNSQEGTDDPQTVAPETGAAASQLGAPGGAILALVGPPGVGKTSLGRSVAEAMGRPYVRVALGGVRDEAEIRGHRRTYVGARPGRIVKALTEAGANNPVMVLDEIDKVGSDWRGDPSSALLEVLDPAQNNTFRDHYLELDVDLSNVVFIATANVLDTIPAPLLDRLEVIDLEGYTHAEKKAIARDHLIGRQVESAGLVEGEVEITDDALVALIEGYTREPGVRGLERQLGKVMRKVAAEVAEGTPGETSVHVNTTKLRDLLGRPRHKADDERPRGVPGVATGLAVTGAGGDVLMVEAARIDRGASSGHPEGDTPGSGSPGLELTGQLGDVMQESGRIAVSYLKSAVDSLEKRSDSGDISEALHTGRFHVHFPAGAVPKDGPSAGVTMTTALVSLLTGRPVRHDVAMTGEVSLHGRVLPIGGVKQKLLAAHRAGMTTVIIPRDNEVDLEDVPDDVLEQLDVHPVGHVEEVLDLALEA
jgi:ATP-dependent Lon protease